MPHARAIGPRKVGAELPAAEQQDEAGQSATEYGQDDHQFT
ncbi:hypothetical protein [Streptomyces sp. NPDC055886]